MYKTVIILCLTIYFVCAGDKSDWKKRSIYQIITDRFARDTDSNGSCGDLWSYCGGTFKGIIKHLDYIQGLGFDSIWISPIVENTGGDKSYHGYWAKNIYKINDHFGTEDELKELSSVLHDRGMYLMIDVVANHMGVPDKDISELYPFNSSDHYHDCYGCNEDCIIGDWNDQTQVEHCRLEGYPHIGMPDLAQDSNDYVSDTLCSWISEMIDKYDIDGIRIDTIPEVSKTFWGKFQSAAGVYSVGECFNGNMDYVSDYQNYLDGMMSYPAYFMLLDVFAHTQDMSKIEYFFGDSGTMWSAFEDVNALGTFIDNHDNVRFLGLRNDIAAYMSVLSFLLYGPGIPILYYGSEQGFAGGKDPENRPPLWDTGYDTDTPLYKFISTAMSFRNKAEIYDKKYVQRYADNQFYAFTRGDDNTAVFIAMTNQGSSSSDISRSITYSPYSEGSNLINIHDNTDVITVGKDGVFDITLKEGLPKIYVNM